MFRLTAENIGDESINSYGNLMKVVGLKGYNNVNVTIMHEINGKNISYSKDVRYQSFKKGNVKSPYDITICGLGYMGEGKYIRGYKTDDGKIKFTKEFELYQGMLNRAIRNNMNVKLCEKWMNFQDFCKWYHDNSYECGEMLALIRLSRDILSPDTCVLLPYSLHFRYSRIIQKKLVGGYKKPESELYESVWRGKLQKKTTRISYLEEWKDKIPDKEYNKIFDFLMQF
jgi:hypothetical protein